MICGVVCDSELTKLISWPTRTWATCVAYLSLR